MVRPSTPLRSTPLAPQRALLHPVWLASLVLLALNDHWLKYAGLLPDVVTGKLSDLAGLVVAPALFATLLGARTRRSLLFAHVAVAAVFTAIQLSSTAAATWSALMAGFGFPWVITSDPTDLLALPMLAVSWRVLGQAMATPAAALARRSAEAGAAAVGLLCSVATSRPDPDPFPEPNWLPPIQGDVWLHNGTGEPLVVRVRALAPTVLLDCGQIGGEPGRLLSDDVFGPVQSWSLPVDANLTVIDHVDGTADCYAARVDADGFEPVVLFWRGGDYFVRDLPGDGLDETLPGWVSLEYDGDGEGSYTARDAILFPRDPESVPPTGACAAPDDADRIDWGDEPVIGNFTIAAIAPGVDGCVALDLVAAGTEGAPHRQYLCMPTLELPFATGDNVALSAVYGAQSEALVLSALDDAYLPTNPTRELWLSRGGALPTITSAPGLQLAAVPAYGCALSVDACGTVGRAVGLTIGGDGFAATQLEHGGAPLTLERDDGSRVTLALAHAQDRVLLDGECAAGPQLLGYDLELAALVEGAAQ
ncbi:MAG: hypothetical protein U0168_10040 [Nannocystaceae bacterium]